MYVYITYTQWASHTFTPKSYSQNEYKTLNQKATTLKCSYTLAAVRKSAPSPNSGIYSIICNVSINMSTTLSILCISNATYADAECI